MPFAVCVPVMATEAFVAGVSSEGGEGVEWREIFSPFF